MSRSLGHSWPFRSIRYMGFSIVGAPLLRTEIAFSLVHPSSGYPKSMLEIFHDVVHFREMFVANRIIYSIPRIEVTRSLHSVVEYESR
jgi:hypothetical protein